MKAITPTTTGNLVSTTDVKLARLLKTRVTVAQLVGKSKAHIKKINKNTILIITNEVYEIKLA